MTTELIPHGGDTLAMIRAELVRDPRLKSPNTQRGYLKDLAAFEDWRKGRPLSKLVAEEYAAELQRGGRSPNGINRALAALRWWARRLGDLAAEGALPEDRRREVTEQAARVASVPDVRGDRKPKGRHISPGELGALLAACTEDPTPAGARDAAIIALASATGARRAELASLQFTDYTPTGEDEGELSIRGKGDKVRTAYVYGGAGLALGDWLRIRGAAPGPLFCAIRRQGRLQLGHGVSGEALAQMLDKRRQAARVKPLTWHDFRRSFAGNLLDAGHDLVTVQKLMGHVSPTTTSNYDRRGEDTKRRAVRSIHIPYTRRHLPT